MDRLVFEAFLRLYISELREDPSQNEERLEMLDISIKHRENSDATYTGKSMLHVFFANIFKTRKP